MHLIQVSLSPVSVARVGRTDCKVQVVRVRVVPSSRPIVTIRTNMEDTSVKVASGSCSRQLQRKIKKCYKADAEQLFSYLEINRD